MTNCAMLLACAMLSRAVVANALPPAIDMGWILGSGLEYLGRDGEWRSDSAIAIVACNPVRHERVSESGYCLVILGDDGAFYWIRGVRPKTPRDDWSTFQGRPLLIYDDARGAWVRP